MATGVDTFFRSRFVDRPSRVRELDPDELPAGFRASGIACGIKDSGNPDVGLLACDSDGATSAARFTRNAVVAAPVTVSRAARLDRLRAVAVNSGNANVSDGRRGLETARAMTEHAAEGLGVDAGRVAVASTGVIGQNLERERVLAGIERALGELDRRGAIAFADAIMTTDRWPKRASLELSLSAGDVCLSAQAKGGGMICPDMATLLCFVETDAAIDATTLDRLLGSAVDRSFNRISVDGQMSTNDSVFAIASGESGVRVEPGSDDERTFAEALDALLLQHAIEIVSDGEGATRIARLRLGGPLEAVEPVARAVATSPLVQTALGGGDPNWGRILQAAGSAIPGAPGAAIDLWIEGVQVSRQSEAVELDADTEALLERAMSQPEVDMRLDLSELEDEATIYFCDIGHDYVSFNAEYTT